MANLYWIDDDGVKHPIVPGRGSVLSINGKTGIVTIDATDVGALPDTTEIPDVPEWALQENKPAYTATEITDGQTNVATEISALSQQKVDKTDYAPVTKTSEMTQAVGKDGSGGLWTAPGGGGGASEEPHNFAFDGANLLEYFADADALWAALAQEDYTHIHLGDYYPVTLNGSYRDYGSMTCQTGQKYYTDTDCTNEVGTAAQDYTANPVADNTLPDSHKAYCKVEISGTTYYCKYAECLPYKVNTLSNAIMKFEAMPNHYWRYGDRGALNFENGKPHILFSPRDGLPTTLKMRKASETWEETTVDEFTGDGTTAEFTLTGTVGTIGYVYVDGAKKAYDTDYTYASNKITFKAGKIPANNTSIKIEWMVGSTPWNGSALYRTFNDPDYGIIKLIQQADAKLYDHIYKGPNAKGMRYYGETRTKTNQQGFGWFDRGLLFLPTEDEIWGRPIHSASDLNSFTQQQQWPLYAGGRRHFAKGAGNGAYRGSFWSASSTGIHHFAFFYNYGFPSANFVDYMFCAVPCFIFCEAPSA